MDTIGKTEDLDPATPSFADIKASALKRDSAGHSEFAGQIAGGRAADCSHERPLAKVKNLDDVVVGICNEA